MSIFTQLGIASINSGACSGPDAWLTSTDTPVITSYNPATQEALGQVRCASLQDYALLIKQAQTTFESWRQVPAPVRGQLVYNIGQALRAHKDALGSLVSMEMGKIKVEGDGEVQEMIDMADFAVGQSRMLYGKTMHSERPRHRMQEQWHPLGIVGVISAFNFPVAVWAWNAFLAAICGNITVWKPSPKTPLCAIAVQHICNQVMKEAGYTGIFNLFIDHPDNTLAKQFIDDPQIAKLSFTGSSQVGREVGVRVAARMGKSLLELSGNNALIVDESADLNLALPSIAFGAVGTAGQRCTTTRRLFIHETRWSEVIEALISAYKQIKIGNPLDPEVLVGPLVDDAAVQRYQDTIARALKEGGKILHGGKALTGCGHFVEPTIIEAENHWQVVQQETFAPILYVMRFQTIEQAIQLQNQAAQGLSSSLFTNDLKHAELFLSANGSDCGIANVNIGTSGAEIGGAFGGEKETGGGREAGSDAWQAYMRRQTNTIFWGNQPALAQGIVFNLR